MTTTTRTYRGDLSSVTVALPTRTVTAVAGEPVEFTGDEAALLGDEWAATAAPAKKAAAKKAPADAGAPDPAAPAADDPITKEA